MGVLGLSEVSLMLPLSSDVGLIANGVGGEGSVSSSFKRTVSKYKLAALSVVRYADRIELLAAVHAPLNIFNRLGRTLLSNWIFTCNLNFE